MHTCTGKPFQPFWISPVQNLAARATRPSWSDESLPMTFIPNPRLPSAADLALRAASIPVACVCWTLGHDLTIHSIAGQLLPLSKAEPGQYLLDRPVSKTARRILVRAAIAVLVGQVQSFELEAHGRRWATILEPIIDPAEADPHRQILGALGTSTLADVPALSAPDTDFIDCYRATADDGPIRAGDVLTCRRSGVVCRTEAIAQRWFDHALALGILSPTDDVTGARSTSPRRGARRGLHLRLLQA